MISITIDESACRSCSLCVDECPTHVLTLDSGAKIPRVDKPGECFGCLSCSEICPSDAIRHAGVTFSTTFHRGPESLAFISGLACGPIPGLACDTSDAGVKKALTDLDQRLLAVGAVFKDILGAGLPPVGVLAGHTLARQRPRHKLPENLDQSLKLAEETFAPAFAIKSKADGSDQLTIDVGDCLVRELCASGKTTLGGELCILFVHCLAGYLSKLGHAHLKLRNAERSMTHCRYQLEIAH